MAINLMLVQDIEALYTNWYKIVIHRQVAACMIAIYTFPGVLPFMASRGVGVIIVVGIFVVLNMYVR